jgi:hypothetical protein
MLMLRHCTVIHVITSQPPTGHRIPDLQVYVFNNSLFVAHLRSTIGDVRVHSNISRRFDIWS